MGKQVQGAKAGAWTDRDVDSVCGTDRVQGLGSWVPLPGPAPRPWGGGQTLAGASVGSASVSLSAQGTRAGRGAVPPYQRPARADTAPWRPRASSQPAAGPRPCEGAGPGSSGAKTSERPYPAAGSAGLGLHPRHLTPLATRYVASASLWVCLRSEIATMLPTLRLRPSAALRAPGSPARPAPLRPAPPVAAPCPPRGRGLGPPLP